MIRIHLWHHWFWLYKLIRLREHSFDHWSPFENISALSNNYPPGIHLRIQMADNCIHCQHPVRAKQQGIQCDGCLKWNHRTCNTGISQQQYRAAVRAGAEIVWFCPPCHPDPVAESSRVSGECNTFDQSNYILESEEFNPPRESFDQSADQSTIYDPQPQVSLILFVS